MRAQALAEKCEIAHSCSPGLKLLLTCLHFEHQIHAALQRQRWERWQRLDEELRLLLYVGGYPLQGHAPKASINTF